MWLCVFVYDCLIVRVNVCMQVCACLYNWMCIWVCCICVHMCVCACVYVRKCIYACAYPYMHKRGYMCRAYGIRPCICICGCKWMTMSIRVHGFNLLRKWEAPIYTFVYMYVYMHMYIHAVIQIRSHIQYVHGCCVYKYECRLCVYCRFL